jgi:hypothetical protein
VCAIALAAAQATADEGGLAQLARALALQARGHRFDSDILHNQIPEGTLA